MGGIGGSDASRLGDDIRLPPAKGVIVQSVTAAAVIDLGTGGISAATSPTSAIPRGNVPSFAQGLAPNNQSTTLPDMANAAGLVGHWIDIEVDSGGGDLGFIAGSTSAAVSGGNAPVLATTGGLGTAGACRRLAAGTGKTFFLTKEERFLGVVSSGTSVVRISQSSR